MLLRGGRSGPRASSSLLLLLLTLTLLPIACSRSPADAALQACRHAVAQKSTVPIQMERRAMEVSSLEAEGGATLQVSGPITYAGPDGAPHTETLDCRVRIAGDAADVIHLQLTWSTQDQERVLRESR